MTIAKYREKKLENSRRMTQDRLSRLEDAVVELHAILHDHLLDNAWTKMWDRIGEIVKEIETERLVAREDHE